MKSFLTAGKILVLVGVFAIMLSILLGLQAGAGTVSRAMLEMPTLLMTGNLCIFAGACRLLWNRFVRQS